MQRKMPSEPAAAMSLSCPGCGAAAAPDDASCRYCSRVLSSVACDACFARLFAGMRYCPQCGSHSSLGTSPGDAEALACPGCGDQHCTSLLTARMVGEHALHECLACHGIWLSAHTVESITTDANARALFGPDVPLTPAGDASPNTRDVAGKRESVRAGKPEGVRAGTLHANTSRSAKPFRYRRCPHCATMMTRVNVAKISGVIVDRCAEHGSFFDIDELHAMVRFLERGGLDRARAREREALMEERRRLQMLMELDERRRAMEYSPRDRVPGTNVGELLGALLGKALGG